MEAAELSKLLEKWGVSTAASSSNGGAAPAADAAEEKDIDIVLATSGDQKINVIKSKTVGLGLKEAKDI